MAFKLAIGNKVGIKVEGEYSDAAGAVKPYSLVLECDRLSAEEIEAEQTKEGGTFAGFFAAHTSGWRDQTLVLGDDDKPAPYSAEALACAMAVPGFAVAAYQAYLAQVGVRQKNSLKPRA